MRFLLLLMLLLGALVTHGQDTTIMRQHLKVLTKTGVPKTYQNTFQLNQTASYIEQQFQQYADSVWVQSFEVRGKTYRNVICSFGLQFAERLIIGAHYDVCGDQEGADDNASGVTGLLELARLLKGQQLTNRIDLVAYTLEEPPFFATENMGSYQHAAYLKAHNVPVIGMVSLEMIGYFDDAKHSQDYPLSFLSLFYGNRGNYITVVNKLTLSRFGARFYKEMKRSHCIRTKRLNAPAFVVGIDFSDHRNYWAFDYPAIMITDTAFYRNKNYHEQSDTMETLDLNRMGEVIRAVLIAVVE
jgi:hypothetical protein